MALVKKIISLLLDFCKMGLEIMFGVVPYKTLEALEVQVC